MDTVPEPSGRRRRVVRGLAVGAVVVASVTGTAGVAAAGTVSPRGNGALAVAVGARSRPLDAPDTRLGSLSGRIEDSSGTGRSGLCVTAVQRSGYETGHLATRLTVTGSGGTYLLAGLPAGRYRLEAASCPRSHTSQSESASWKERFEVRSFTAIVVAHVLRTLNTERLPAVLVHLDAHGRPVLSEMFGRTERLVESAKASAADTGAIEGTVTDTHGNGLAGICVVAGSRSRSSAYRATTGSGGAYEIAKMPAGTYSVGFVTGCGNKGNWYAQWYKDSDEPPGTPVKVRGGKTTSHIDAQLGEGGGLSGRVETAAGKAVRPACVLAQQILGHSTSLYEELTSTGEYSLPDLNPGPWTVGFVACGNQNLAPQWWDRQSNGADATVIHVKPGPTVANIDGYLTPGAEITGTVTDELGYGLKGVCVEAVPHPFPVNTFVSIATVTTTSGGEFRLRSLGTGSYVLAAAPGCGNNGNYAPADSSGIVRARAGQVTSGQHVTLPPGAVVSGTITDSSAKPLSGICAVIGGSALPFGQEVATKDGKYRLDQLPAGSYSMAFGPGCGNKGNYIDQYYGGAESPSEESSFELGTGQSMTVNVTLQTGGSLQGTVTSTSGKAVRGACVALAPPNGGALGVEPFGVVGDYGILSSKTGAFDVHGLPTDPYSVFIDPGCGRGSTSSYAAEYLGGGSVAPGRYESVTAGQSTSGLAIDVPAGGSISGTLLAEGKPFNDGFTSSSLVCLEIYSQSGAFEAEVLPSVSSNGHFSFGNMLAGSYLVAWLSCSGGSRFGSEWYDASRTPAKATPLFVPAGAHLSGINFDLPPTAIIVGTVTGPGDAAVGHTCVFAQGANGYAAAMTDSVGRYRLTGVGTGDYELVAGDCSAPGDLAEVVLHHVHARDGATTLGVDASLPEGGTIAGRITGPGGERLGGVCVYAGGGAGGLIANEGVSAPSGVYRITGVLPGTWPVKVLPDCGAYGSLAPGGVASVTVTAGEWTSGVNVQLAADGSISGTIADGLSGVCVTAFPLGSTTSITAAEQATSISGAYTIVGLPAGSYDVEFAPGCGSAADLKPVWWEGASSQATATPVIVRDGTDTGGIDATMSGG
ncbi:MAG: carboxypeptidase regulatory-like domain-containing protein [Acidimicrobiales bacterium]|jgi:hypothetical protein